MLNKKQDVNSVSSSENLNLRQKPKIKVLPDLDEKNLNTDNLEEAEQIFEGTEPIVLSGESLKNYIESIKNPPKPSTYMINSFNRFLVRSK